MAVVVYAPALALSQGKCSIEPNLKLTLIKLQNYMRFILFYHLQWRE